MNEPSNDQVIFNNYKFLGTIILLCIQENSINTYYHSAFRED